MVVCVYLNNIHVIIAWKPHFYLIYFYSCSYSFISHVCTLVFVCMWQCELALRQCCWCIYVLLFIRRKNECEGSRKEGNACLLLSWPILCLCLSLSLAPSFSLSLAPPPPQSLRAARCHYLLTPTSSPVTRLVMKHRDHFSHIQIRSRSKHLIKTWCGAVTASFNSFVCSDIVWWGANVIVRFPFAAVSRASSEKKLITPPMNPRLGLARRNVQESRLMTKIDTIERKSIFDWSLMRTCKVCF